MKYSVRLALKSSEMTSAKLLIRDAFERRGLDSTDGLEYDSLLACFDARTDELLGAATITKPDKPFRCEQLYQVALGSFLPGDSEREDYFELSAIAKSLSPSIPRNDMVFLALILGATGFAQKKDYFGWLATMPPPIAGMLRRCGFELQSLRFSVPPKPIFKGKPGEIKPEVVMGNVHENAVLITNKFGSLVERGIISVQL